MVIVDDNQTLNFSEDEMEIIKENPDVYDSRMAQQLPGGTKHLAT